MNKKTAVVIGATGLVGSQLIQLLINDERFSLIKIFGRRRAGVQHENIEEHIINFEWPEKWKHLITDDVLFSSLGTTLKQAGSK